MIREVVKELIKVVARYVLDRVINSLFRFLPTHSKAPA